MDSINFRKLENDNENIILFYDPEINEGLIGIIAARLKEYFNKPVFFSKREHCTFKIL